MSFLDLFAGQPSPDGFAKMVMARMRAAGVVGVLTYDPSEFRINVGDNPIENSLFLSNAYQEYCKAPRSNRRALLQKYIQFMASPRPDPPARFEDAKPHLLPRVRDRYFYEAMRMRMLIDYGHAHEVPTLPIADHLAVELVYDFPDSVATVNRCQFDNWNVSLEESLAVARDNLWKISNEPFQEAASGLFVSPWNDSHAASRLFLHDLIWQLPVKGDHVAMVPHRDLLIVTGADDAAGLTAMCALAEDTLGEPRGLTARPVRLQGKEWTTFEPGPDHPAFTPLNNLKARVEADEYARQKELLEAKFKKDNDDVFVPTVMLTQNQETRLLSTIAAWSDGVAALIPKVDRIGFVCADAQGNPSDARVAEWDKMFAIVSELIKPAGLYPERYRVTAFPNEVQLVAMEAKTPNVR